jgi:diacylglycerol kinase family enzyme
MLVFVNPCAGYGRAKAQWSRLQRELGRRCVADDVITVMETGPQLDEQIGEAIESGERFLVAAGGDGTVHLVVNAVMRLPDGLRRGLSFGAIGLGSSNDFHKPMRAENTVEGVPVRINLRSMIRHNLVKFTWNEDRRTVTEYSIVNASIGLVADANRLFNNGDRALRWVKSLSIAAAIRYSALKTLIIGRDRCVRLSVDGVARERTVSNLGIIINPHFGGDCRYDTPISPDGDFMRVNLCEDMSPWRKLCTFRALERGRFAGLPGTSGWECSRVEVESLTPFTLELDGEVRQTQSVTAEFIKGGLAVCN